MKEILRSAMAGLMVALPALAHAVPAAPRNLRFLGTGGGGPGCTPFALWPAICREDLPAAMSGFVEPAQPVFSGYEVTVTSSSGVYFMGNGNRAVVTQSFSDLVQVNGNDRDIVIADGVTIGDIVLDCDRCRLRGGGPNARVGKVTIYNAADVTVDSLLIKPSNGIAIEMHNSPRTALVSLVAVSPNTCGMFANNMNNLLIAGVNWGSADAGGVNDWAVRLAHSNDVVIVDSQAETLGWQPVLRRSGTSSRHFYFRTTTVSLYSYESTFDLGGASNDDFYDHMYQRSPTYYVSNLNPTRTHEQRYGPLGNDDGGVGIYEVRDAIWHTPPSGVAFMDLAGLQMRENGQPVRQLRLGTPGFYHTLSGDYNARHPGWPARWSHSLGQFLSVANPYGL